MKEFICNKEIEKVNDYRHPSHSGHEKFLISSIEAIGTIDEGDIIIRLKDKTGHIFRCSCWIDFDKKFLIIG